MATGKLPTPKKRITRSQKKIVKEPSTSHYAERHDRELDSTRQTSAHPTKIRVKPPNDGIAQTPTCTRDVGESEGHTRPQTPRSSTVLIEAVTKLSDQMINLSHSLQIIGTRLIKVEQQFELLNRTHDKETIDLDSIISQLSDTTTATKKIEETCETLQSEIRADRRMQQIEQECKSCIEGYAVPWRELLHLRAISYWHCLQNYSKAELYGEWLENSPEYLPLKYRPKVNSSDSQLAMEQKLKAAEQRYRDDIKLMYSYSEEHEEKVDGLDRRAQLLIEEMAESDDHGTILQQFWYEQTTINALKSKRLWIRRHDFLSKKKEEEEMKGDYKTLNEHWYRPKFKKRDKTRKSTHQNIDVDKIPPPPTMTA